MRDLIELST